MHDWHCNQRLLQKLSFTWLLQSYLLLTYISIFLPTYLRSRDRYSYARDGYPCVLTFHGDDVLCALLINRVITYMYTCPTGDRYVWICPLYPVWLLYRSRYCCRMRETHISGEYHPLSPSSTFWVPSSFNTEGKYSGSINPDPINMIHTSQKSTKEGVNEDLEEYFINSK